MNNRADNPLVEFQSSAPESLVDTPLYCTVWLEKKIGGEKSPRIREYIPLGEPWAQFRTEGAPNGAHV